MATFRVIWTKWQSLLHFWTLNRELLWQENKRKFWELQLNFKRNSATAWCAMVQAWLQRKGVMENSICSVLGRLQRIELLSSNRPLPNICELKSFKSHIQLGQNLEHFSRDAKRSPSDIRATPRSHFQVCLEHSFKDIFHKQHSWIWLFMPHSWRVTMTKPTGSTLHTPYNW